MAAAQSTVDEIKPETVEPEVEAASTEDAPEAVTYPSGRYRVTVGAIVLAVSSDPRKGANRYGAGDIVKLDSDIHEIDRLIKLGAIVPMDSKVPEGAKMNAAMLARRANAANQVSQAEFLPDGQPVEQAN